MAQGSQSTFGGWESKVCKMCGAKVVKSSSVGYMFYYDHVTGESSTTCGPCLRGQSDMSPRS